MKQWLPVGVLLAGLMAGASAHADVIDWLGWGDTRPQTKDLPTVYVGGGFTNAFFHANVEAPTPYGNTYLKLGQYYDGEGLAALAGWRYPYALTGVDQNGYYLGGFVGHIESDSLNAENYNRLGAGLELSYVFMNPQRAGAASVSVAGGEEKTGDNGEKRRSKPIILFSLTFGIGMF